jgi:hypothetical protein
LAPSLVVWTGTVRVPWCDDCSKFWNAPDLNSADACPSCGRVIAGTPPRPAVAPTLAGGPATPAHEEPGLPGTTTKAKGAPWHFKLLVVGVTVYMIYRIYWLIEWLPKHV